MHPRDPRMDSFIGMIRERMKGKFQDEWAGEIAGVLEAFARDGDVLAALLIRLQSETANLPGALWIARELVLPQLQMRLAIEQQESAKSVGRSANRLALAAMIFGGIQATCALISLYIAFHQIAGK